MESAHYKDLDVLIANEGQSRIDLYNEGKVVDTIHVYRWTMEEVRILLEDLGLSRDETYTWAKRDAENKLAQAFMDPSKGLQKDEL